MKQRGRKSLAELTTPVDLKRLQPPEELSDKQQAFFVQIVNSLPADYFGPSDAPLLAAYCTSVDYWLDATAIVNRDGQVLESINGNQYAHPAIKLVVLHSGNMASLAQKLRLNPASRISSSAAAKGGRSAGAAPPWEDKGDGDPAPGLPN